MHTLLKEAHAAFEAGLVGNNLDNNAPISQADAEAMRLQIRSLTTGNVQLQQNQAALEGSVAQVQSREKELLARVETLSARLDAVEARLPKKKPRAKKAT